jgi:hypothetical protein
MMALEGPLVKVIGDATEKERGENEGGDEDEPISTTVVKI